ncbi:hypothetical protein AB0892_25045 [Streptomyces sp. NPDC005409]|uniref:hypothetical protein n=1 Tax=Streptomyces sp. NPDC005409 TaxID=3155342 RepID=UPI0034514D88
MQARLVFVHGIGGLRDPARELTVWTRALASGMRAAGHGAAARDLLSGTSGGPAGHVFVHYADLFTRGQAQGGDVLGAPGAAGAAALEDAAEAEILSELLVAWVDGVAAGHAERSDERDRRILDHARAQARPRAQEQGSLAVVRRALNVATTLLALKPWGGAARWITPKMMVSHLAQVARYLARGEPDDQGVSLDRRIRARVCEAIGNGPAVVVAHSLGSVVALETLHQLAAPVPLLVTLGSPIATRSVVWPRLLPQPPSVPGCIGAWLNFWDRDDIIAVRPHLERELRPSDTGVTPTSRRVDSDGAWVHDAEKYLAQPAVAGPVAEALAAAAGGAGSGGGGG